MAGITLSDAQTALSNWLAAANKIAEGQEYTIEMADGSSRTLKRANLKEVHEMIIFWDKQVQRLSRGGIRVRGIQPE